MRYSKTERLGIIETDSIVTKQLGWIFREQPIVDVGIDAIIEKSDNGEPAGKFIAVQIKSGEGNFYFKKNYVSYYVSNIHYNYWLNLNIPIILVAYLPDTDMCYWQIIDKSTLKKTKRRWKINIPKKNTFISSKITLTKLLVEVDTTNIFNDVYRYDYDLDFSEELDFLTESRFSAKKIGDIITEFRAEIRIFSRNNESLRKNGYRSNGPQVQGNMKLQSRFMTSTSHRLVNEIQMFSQFFPEEIYLLEQLIYEVKTKKVPINKDLKIQIKLSQTLLEDTSQHIKDLSNILDGITGATTTSYPSVYRAKVALINAFDVASYEFNTASYIAKNISNAIEQI